NSVAADDGRPVVILQGATNDLRRTGGAAVGEQRQSQPGPALRISSRVRRAVHRAPASHSQYHLAAIQEFARDARSLRDAAVRGASQIDEQLAYARPLE